MVKKLSGIWRRKIVCKTILCFIRVLYLLKVLLECVLKWPLWAQLQTSEGRAVWVLVQDLERARLAGRELNVSFEAVNHPAFSISIPPKCTKCKLRLKMWYRHGIERGFFFLRSCRGSVECAAHLVKAASCLDTLAENSGRPGTGCPVLFSGNAAWILFCSSVSRSFTRGLGGGVQVLRLVKQQPPVVLGPRCDIHSLLIASLKPGLGCSS